MNKRLLVFVLSACIGLLAVGQVNAAGPVPGHSNAFGKPLGEWMKLYWTWALGGDQEGRVGDVVFLPLPDAEQWDPEVPIFGGEADVTLQTGEKFVLPMFVFIGETYTEDSGVPDDDPADIPDFIFTAADVLISLDGEPIIDSETNDLTDYLFGPEYFDSTIYYATPTDYEAIGAVWVKGIGFAHNPLPKGQHTLVLSIDTGFGFGYYNIWNITVE